MGAGIYNGGGGGGWNSYNKHAVIYVAVNAMYLYSVVKNPLTAKRGVLQSNLRITDVQSLYPWNGISDAAVDFYIRSAIVYHAPVLWLSVLTIL